MSIISRLCVIVFCILFWLFARTGYAETEQTLYSFSPPTFNNIQVAHDGTREFTIHIGRIGSSTERNIAKVQVSGAQQAIQVDDEFVFEEGESLKDLSFVISGQDLEFGTYTAILSLTDKSFADLNASPGTNVAFGVGASISFEVVDRVDPANYIVEAIPDQLKVTDVRVQSQFRSAQVSVTGRVQNISERTFVNPRVGVGFRTDEGFVHRSGQRIVADFLAPGAFADFEILLSSPSQSEVNVVIESCCTNSAAVVIYEDNIKIRSSYLRWFIVAAVIVFFLVLVKTFFVKKKSRIHKKR